MHTPHLSLLAPLLSLALVSHSLADDHMWDEDEAYQGEIPLVLSATRISQPLNEVPISMSVIDEEMIIASGARTIPELFRLVPGFQVMYSNTTNMGVTSHGLSEHVSKRMQVLINGRSVYLPTTGGVPWSNLPITIEDIKRIEVVRGPNAATYGANAYLGVINIITKHSVEDLGTSFKLTGGYNEHRKIDIRHGNSLGDIDYRIGFSALTEEGFIERHDGQEQGILTGRFDYQVTANDSLFLEAGLNQSYKKDGHVDSSLNPPHMQNGDYNFQLMRWEHSNDANNQFSLQLSHQYYELDDNYRAIANVSGMDVFSNIDFDYSGRRYAAEFQHNFTLGNSVKALWGLGAREDSVNSVGYLGTDATLENTLLRAYANVELKLTDSLLLNGGLMYEESDLIGDDTSPKIGLVYKLNPSNTFRVSYSKASRNPVLYEDQANAEITLCLIAAPTTCFPLTVYSSTGGLKSEVIRSAEIGWLGQYRSVGLTTDIRLFHDELRRMVGTISDIHQNLDHATADGVELEIDFSPTDKTRVHASYSRAFVSSSDYSDDGIEEATPENSYNILLIQRIPRLLDVSLNFYHMDEIHGLGTGDDTGPIDRLDLRLSRSVSFGGNKATIAMVVQNTLDEDYREYDKDNLFERRGYLELLLSL